MPDGVASIEDMIVVVGADTDKLRSGLAAADGIVSKFSESGSAKLGKMDAAVATLGGGVQGLVGKAGPALAALTLGLEALDGVLEKAAQIGSAIGMEDEINAIRANVAELGETIGGLLPAIFGNLSAAGGHFASNLTKTVDSLNTLAPGAKKAALETEQFTAITTDTAKASQAAADATVRSRLELVQYNAQIMTAAAATAQMSESSERVTSDLVMLQSTAMLAGIPVTALAAGFRDAADEAASASDAARDAMQDAADNASSTAGSAAQETAADVKAETEELLGFVGGVKALLAGFGDVFGEISYGIQKIADPELRSDDNLERFGKEMRERLADVDAVLAEQDVLIDMFGRKLEGTRAQMNEFGGVVTSQVVGPLEKTFRSLSEIAAMGGLDGLKSSLDGVAASVANVDQKMSAAFGGVAGIQERIKAEIAANDAEIERRDYGVSARIRQDAEETMRLGQRKADTVGWTVGELAGVEFYERTINELEKEGIKLKEKHLDLIAEMGRKIEEQADENHGKKVVDGIRRETEAMEAKLAVTDRTIEGLRKQRVEEAARKTIGDRPLSEDEDAQIGGMAARQGAAEASAAVDKYTESLDKEVAALGRKAEALGLTAGATARLNAEEKLRATLGRDLTDAEKEKVEERLAKLEAETERVRGVAAVDGLRRETEAMERKAAATDRSAGAMRRLQVEESARRSLSGRDLTDGEQDAVSDLAGRQGSAESRMQFARALDGLDREAMALEKKANALRLTAGETARLAAEERLRAQLGRELTASDLKGAARQLDRIEGAAQEGADNRGTRDAARDIKAIEQKTEALLMNKNEIAALAAEEKYLATIQKDRSDLDQREVDNLRRISGAAYDATNAYELLSRQLQSIQGAVDIAARTMNSAFDKFASGAKISVKEMVASMLRDLAKLTFQQAVMKNLSEMVMTGFKGFLSGMRADGGPVGAGEAYIVGERGPELFMPGAGGQVVSNENIMRAMSGQLRATAGGGTGAANRGGNGGASGEILVRIEHSPEMLATIDSRVNSGIRTAAPQIVGTAVRTTEKQLPGMLSSAQQRSL